MSDSNRDPAVDTPIKERPRLAIGIDLVAVEEVQAAVARFGDRYLSRVFTDHEVACSSGEGVVGARRLAVRFAAKEATMKALGPSDGRPEWRSIEVRQEESGRCTLRLSGQAAELARQAKLSDFGVSLSHEGNLAAAVVLAMGPVER